MDIGLRFNGGRVVDGTDASRFAGARGFRGGLAEPLGEAERSATGTIDAVVVNGSVLRRSGAGPIESEGPLPSRLFRGGSAAA